MLRSGHVEGGHIFRAPVNDWWVDDWRTILVWVSVNGPPTKSLTQTSCDAG